MKVTGVEIDQELVEIILNVHVCLQDSKKVALWMNSKNLNLGGFTPFNLIRIGRGKRVLQFTQQAADSNQKLAMPRKKEQ